MGDSRGCSYGRSKSRRRRSGDLASAQRPNIDQHRLAVRRPKRCAARRRWGDLPDARKTHCMGNPIAPSFSTWRRDFGLLIVPSHCPVRVSKRQRGRTGRRPMTKQPSTSAVLANSEDRRGAAQPVGERLTSFPTKPSLFLLGASIKHCRRPTICPPVNGQTPRHLRLKGDNSSPDEMSTIYYDVRKMIYYANGLRIRSRCH